MVSLEKVETSLKSLNNWVRENGWLGYDPYDIKGIPELIWIQKHGLLRKGFNVVAEIFPYTLRRIFRVKPVINAKAMVLFSRAYLNMYRHGAEEQSLKAAKECLTWLMENSRPGYSGPCWGYPFDWQTKTFIPKETPSGIVTSMAAGAFLEAYEILQNESYLDFAKGCCEFLIKDLNWDQITPESGCFSYTPIDSLHIHNANLWVAATTYRVGALISNSVYSGRALQALRYTLEAQHPNGSWTYRGHPDCIQGVIDNYHTGFVLRALFDIYSVDPKPEILFAIRKGVHFYCKKLLVGDRIPRRTARRLYPIDIHSCSEAILCCSALSAIFPKLLDVAREVIGWTLAQMQDPRGFFYYRNYRIYISKVGFIRWGQAWMMLALSEYLLRASGEIPNKGQNFELDQDEQPC